MEIEYKQCYVLIQINYILYFSIYYIIISRIIYLNGHMLNWIKISIELGKMEEDSRVESYRAGRDFCVSEIFRSCVSSYFKHNFFVRNWNLTNNQSLRLYRSP